MISEILAKKSYYLPKHTHDGGATKETHFASSGNDKYILRICHDDKSRSYCHEAFRVFSNKNILPKLIEEKEENFLIEFIIGRDLKEKNESLDNIKRVGIILAQVNRVKKEFDYKKIRSEV